MADYVVFDEAVNLKKSLAIDMIFFRYNRKALYPRSVARRVQFRRKNNKRNVTIVYWREDPFVLGRRPFSYSSSKSYL